VLETAPGVRNDRVNSSDENRVGYEKAMVEAAGIEPLLPSNLNPMMANDFGFYDMKTFELPRR